MEGESAGQGAEAALTVCLTAGRAGSDSGSLSGVWQMDRTAVAWRFEAYYSHCYPYPCTRKAMHTCATLSHCCRHACITWPRVEHGQAPHWLAIGGSGAGARTGGCRRQCRGRTGTGGQPDECARGCELRPGTRTDYMRLRPMPRRRARTSARGRRPRLTRRPTPAVRVADDAPGSAASKGSLPPRATV